MQRLDTAGVLEHVEQHFDFPACAVPVRLGRTCPDLDAELFFDPDEIQAAYLLRKKTPPDKPRLNDVLRQIACIGGFLARKSDGEPGVKTIWLGLKDVYVAAETIRALREIGALNTCV